MMRPAYLSLDWSPSRLYLLIRGWGFVASSYAKHRAYFSERNGIRQPAVRAFGWRLFWLSPGAREEEKARAEEYVGRRAEEKARPERRGLRLVS